MSSVKEGKIPIHISRYLTFQTIIKYQQEGNNHLLLPELFKHVYMPLTLLKKLMPIHSEIALSSSILVTRRTSIFH